MAEYYETPELGAWLHEPELIREPGRWLVCVHGISRNAREQLVAFKPVADALGIRLIAPNFCAQRFPGYQRLDQRPGHDRADLALNRLLLQLDPTCPQPRLDLFGYSGGAQFSHRYALCYPRRVRSLMLAAAGWYTFPDSNVRYPRGLAAWPEALPQPPAHARQFLSIPTLITIGSLDTQRDASLRRGERIDHQQGRTRLERAQRWFEYCRSLGAGTDWQLEQLEGVGHSFADSVAETRLLHLITHFLQSQQENS